MTNITYETSGTCSKLIEVEIENSIIQKVNFVGGCPGNTQGVASLVRGMEIKQVIKRLKGIDCKGKGTSCPDQLAKALETITE